MPAMMQKKTLVNSSKVAEIVHKLLNLVPSYPRLFFSRYILATVDMSSFLSSLDVASSTLAVADVGLATNELVVPAGENWFLDAYSVIHVTGNFKSDALVIHRKTKSVYLSYAEISDADAKHGEFLQGFQLQGGGIS